MANRLLSKPKVSQKTTTTRGLMPARLLGGMQLSTAILYFGLHSYKVLLDAGAGRCRKPFPDTVSEARLSHGVNRLGWEYRR
jgi:hypothetical protein